MKRALPLVLVAACFALAVVELGASGGQESAATAAPMTISWFGQFGAKIQEGNEVQVHLEKKFNVKLVNKQLDWADVEKLNLMIASGEATDAMACGVGARSYYLRGAFRSIPKAMIVKYVPSQAKYLDSIGPIAWKYCLVPGTKDEYMGLVTSMEYKMGVTYMPFMRLDWLEKIGMAPKELIDSGYGPSEGKSYWTKQVYSFDEFQKILYAFRDRDLDGNGKADTIPYASIGDLSNKGLGNILNLFGFGEVVSYNDNGKAVDMAVHSRYKDFLKLAQKWYQDKILDSELPSVSKKVREDKVANGLAGSYTDARIYISYGVDPTSTGYNPQLLYARNPAAKVVMVPVPRGPDGTQTGITAVGAAPLNPENFFVIRKGVSDEKLVKILQIAQYVNWDPEGRIYARFGWPGKHFTWAGEPWNSYCVLAKSIEYGGATGIRYYTYENNYAEIYKTFMLTPEARPIEEYFAYGEGSKVSRPAYREDVLGETNYAKLRTQFGSSLNTIRDEFTWRAITTKMNIDAEWDAYVAKWMKSGGEELTKEFAKMPIVSELIKGNVVY